jgi:hypothetical protein
MSRRWSTRVPSRIEVRRRFAGEVRDLLKGAPTLGREIWDLLKGVSRFRNLIRDLGESAGANFPPVWEQIVATSTHLRGGSRAPEGCVRELAAGLGSALAVSAYFRGESRAPLWCIRRLSADLGADRSNLDAPSRRVATSREVCPRTCRRSEIGFGSLAASQGRVGGSRGSLLEAPLPGFALA